MTATNVLSGEGRARLSSGEDMTFTDTGGGADGWVTFHGAHLYGEGDEHIFSQELHVRVDHIVWVAPR
jgi:hypothetical protein